MKLFNGRKVADKILKDLKVKIKENKLKPKLAVVLIGNDGPSKIYVRLKREAGKKIGVKVDVYKFDSNNRESIIIKKIKELNQDKKVNGIIVQLPLPLYFSKNKIIGAINPLKNVDGFHKKNQTLFKKGKQRFAPPLPEAILLAIRDAYTIMSCRTCFGISGQKILKQVQDDKSIRIFKNKKAMALVNSETFGNVLKMVLGKEGIKMSYIIRKVCMISGAEEEFQDADILITACGCPNLIGKEMIKKGAIVIDAGITRYHNKKVVGDVNRKEIAKKAKFLTPVPGGVGPVAVALLLSNVIRAVKD